MKIILSIITSLVFLSANSQEVKPKFDGKNWKAPYSLDIPAGWDIERFLIPIEFAPSISYKGIEDIRFTPGWSKAETDDYWSYAFLWYLDSAIKFTPGTMQKNL